MPTRPTLAADRLPCPVPALACPAIRVVGAAIVAAAILMRVPAVAENRRTEIDATLDLAPTLEAICATHDVPAIAAAAIKDGELWGLGAAGLRQRGQAARVTPDDRWYIGSCGRAMTALLAAVLVEKGAIAWDSTVADILPQVGESARPEYRGATLEQLLRGLGGLPDDPGADSPIWRLVRGAGGSMRDRRITVAKIALRQEPAPGGAARRHDSGLAFVVAGAMLEAAGDRAFEELMREHVFAPLEMRTAGFGAPGNPRALDEPVGHAGGFGGRPRPLPPSHESYQPPVMAPAGTVHCSIADWARFAQLILRGARGEEALLISPESFGVILTDMRSRRDAPMGWELGARSWAGGAALIREEEGPWYAAIWIGPGADVAYVVAANRGDGAGSLAGAAALGAMIYPESPGSE